MTQQLPIGAQEYYDLLPPFDHQPGDVWSSLPTYGTLRLKSVSGIVVTPACDLANRKVETITYLPIVSLQEYFSSRACLPDHLKVIDGQLTVAGLDVQLSSLTVSLPPSAQDLDAV